MGGATSDRSRCQLTCKCHILLLLPSSLPLCTPVCFILFYSLFLIFMFSYFIFSLFYYYYYVGCRERCLLCGRLSSLEATHQRRSVLYQSKGVLPPSTLYYKRIVPTQIFCMYPFFFLKNKELETYVNYNYNIIII